MDSMMPDKKPLYEPSKPNLMSRLSNTGARARRIILMLLVIVIGAFMFYSFFSGSYGFARIVDLNVQKGKLIEENHQLLVKLINADITRYRLLNDTSYIEYIARTRHFLSREGEVIYRFKQ